MQIGLLFYSDTVALSQTLGAVKGRAVANNGLLRALLAHPGDCAYTVIVSCALERDWLRDALGALAHSRFVRLVTLQELPRALAEAPLDALHLFGPDLYRGFALRREVLRAPVPVTGTTHTLSHAPFLEWMYLNLLHRPQSHDCLVCTTPTAVHVVDACAATAREALGGAGVLPTTVIPLGVDVAALRAPALPSRVELRARHGIPADAIMLLSVGRLSSSSKTDLLPLVLAFRQLRQQTHAEVRLVLAGASGDERYADVLAAAAGECGVHEVLTIVPDPDEANKHALYQAADIFVGMSDNLQETFGLTVVEAMACGLPVVASSWDGYRALVRDGETGFLIPTTGLAESSVLQSTAALQLDSVNHLMAAQSTATDLPALVDRLHALVTQPELRVRMAREAFASAMAYDWPVVARHYQALWERLATAAQHTTWQDAPPATLDYLRAFADYPTRHLQGDHTVTTTATGHEVLAGRVPLRLYAAMEEILRPELLAALLRDAASEQPVAALLERHAAAASPDLLRHHLMWLYKYGFIALR